MQPVANTEQYYALLRNAKARGACHHNQYLFPQALEHDVETGRLYVEETEDGVFFFADEETFYQCTYYLKPEAERMTGKKEKPVLIEHIYRDGKKKKELDGIEQLLQKTGFAKVQTVLHAVLEHPEALYEKTKKTAERVRKLLTTLGMCYAPVDRELLEKTAAFRKTIAEIPYYQIPYFTEEAYLQEGKAGRYCCVSDSSGTVIAARHLILSGKKAYGWVGVAEPYQERYGIAVLFLHDALRLILEQQLKMCSWVDETNLPSIRYHEHIGSRWTGHRKENWLL